MLYRAVFLCGKCRQHSTYGEEKKLVSHFEYLEKVTVMKENRLINEKSPYLLQHAHNPVDWFPWGEEAFKKSRAENKLIMLSIGYATCHWCHVMERESFEDEKTAEYLNRYFISIKVDREERPDIDKIYMDALHATGQQGGWPLNIFLTPDKKPIAGGTYFPPVPRYGRNSFTEVLAILNEAWTNKQEEILKSAEELTKYLKSESLQKEEADLPFPEVFDSAFKMYDKFFDETFAGFKTNMVNKFPPSMGLSFLLVHHNFTGDERALPMVEKTLQAMRKGGIYDQIGGGLSRYATDHMWLVPHFEKMLYDNSLFLVSLAECYKITGKDFYKSAAIDVINYISRDMKLTSGGIASAEDADSEGEEGKFYVFSASEIRTVCRADSKLLEEFWNISEEGNFEGLNILNESFTADFPKVKGMSPENWNEILSKNRAKLLEYRNKRIRPLRDDKVLTSWNCLYIRALIKSGEAFNDSALIREAEDLYRFIEKNLINEKGRLLRRFREGESGIHAYLPDYSEFSFVSILLYRITHKIGYMERAIRFTEDTIRLFGSEFGPFYETATDGEELIRRSIDGYDGVEPSGNSTMCHVLLQLASYGINPDKYRGMAEKIFGYFSKELNSAPVSFPNMLSALHSYHHPAYEIAVVGKAGEKETLAILDYLNSRFLPGSVIAFTEMNTLSENSKIIPLLENRFTEKSPAIFLCKNSECKLPVYSLEDLKKVLSN